MHYGVLALTFLSVNLDFFFMLLFLVRKYRLYQVMAGYVLGVTILVTASFLVGKTLSAILPEWALGFLGILPIYLAFKNDDDDEGAKTNTNPILAVLVTYLAVCAGCNLAIFLPVLAGESVAAFGQTLIFIAVLSALVTALIRALADVPMVAKLMTRFGEPLMKLCYVAIGIYVFFDSGLIAHLLH